MKHGTISDEAMSRLNAISNPDSALREHEHYTTVCDSADRAKWLGLRATGIGASEMPAVLGESTWTSPLELYLNKVDPPPAEPDEGPGVRKDYRWVGRKIEDFNAGLYRDLTGRDIRKSGMMLRSRQEPWALATLDYETLVDGVWCPLEIKNVDARKASQWAEGPPPLYAVQGQQQSMVTRAPLTSFFALIGGNRPVWDDVPADKYEHARITHHGREFWHRVQHRCPPLPDGSASADRAIARMYDTTSIGKTVRLSTHAQHCADELARIQEEMRVLKALKKEHEQAVKAQLGDAEYGALPDGRVFSYRNIVKEAHEVDRCEYRRLYLHKSQPKPRR